MSSSNPPRGACRICAICTAQKAAVRHPAEVLVNPVHVVREVTGAANVGDGVAPVFRANSTAQRLLRRSTPSAGGPSVPCARPTGAPLTDAAISRPCFDAADSIVVASRSAWRQPAAVTVLDPASRVLNDWVPCLFHVERKFRVRLWRGRQSDEEEATQDKHEKQGRGRRRAGDDEKKGAR